MEFPSEQEAHRFEKYLKSASGRAFTKRHFGPLANESLVASAERDHRHDDEA